MNYTRHLFIFVLANFCLFSKLSWRPVWGQFTTRRNVNFAFPICNTECPENKRCLQDNVTIIWGYVNGDKLCDNYRTCYGPSSDYVENSPGFFPVRLKPVDVAQGSSVYFVSKGYGGMSFSFQVYNVSRENFFSCSTVGGEQVSSGLITALKVPAKFLSSLGYKFFIATGNVLYRCRFGLRLHMNVKDATNCSGHSTLPTGAQLCSGKGICVSDSFTALISCECCSGYTGRYCQEYNACSLNPCQRGNCTDVVAGHLGDFHCLCPIGYTGHTCDRDIDDCGLQPCQNGGLCQDGLNSYTCLCPPEIHGMHCEYFSNLCEILKPCENGGNCTRVGISKQSYVCHCAPGFTGQNCTVNATVTISTGATISSTVFHATSSMLHSDLTPSIAGSSDMKHWFSSSILLTTQRSEGIVASSSFPKTWMQSNFTTYEKSSTGFESTSQQKISTLRKSLLSSISHISEASGINQPSVTVRSASLSGSTSIKSIIPLSSTTHSSTFQSFQNPTPSLEDSQIIANSVDTLSMLKSSTFYEQSSSKQANSSGVGFVGTQSITVGHTRAVSSRMFSIETQVYSFLVPSRVLESQNWSSVMEHSSSIRSNITSQTLSVHSISALAQTSLSSIDPILTQAVITRETPAESSRGISPLLPSTTLNIVVTESKPTVVIATSLTASPRPKVTSSMSPTLVIPSTASSIYPVMVTSPILSTSKLPSVNISSSTTLAAATSSLLPTVLPPLENQTCADNPCGRHGVCTSANSSVSQLLFHCDCQYPTVGPICTTDLELHFPYFSGKSYIEHKPIMFGSLENKFVISFRTEMDGTILYSGHNSYRDFFKLEVLGGKLRFSVDAGEEVISVTSSDIVTDGNTTSAIAVYDTRAGTVSMTVNNGPGSRSTFTGGLREIQLYQALYVGGIIPSTFTENKPGVGVITPFVGCIRELEFNDRAILLSDALDWQNISECDVPACRALPCKNGGSCFQDVQDLNEYYCECRHSYSGNNCEKKYACLVNICNGGTCLNATSGPECLCPFGRGGMSCNQNIRIDVPSFTVTNDYSSFLQYTTPRGVIDQLDIHLQIKPSDHVRARRSALLFYIGLHDHLSVGSDGDYLALGILNNRVLLQYNLGSGIANITSQQELDLHKTWYTVLAGRKGRVGYLYIDHGDMQEGHSPPPLVALNVFGHMYLGGVPDVSQLNSEVVFEEGFRGIIKDPKIRIGSSNSWFPMAMKHSTNNSNELTVVSGLNIQNQRVNACVAGACLNNGSCESLGASYVCRCLPQWSGMRCNDTSIPCREYNPCQGLSTCRTRDSGITCDCPLGKAGKYCQNDLNITTPYFQEYSYMSFSLVEINVQSKMALRIGFSPSTHGGILFYITKDIKSPTGDFMSITLHDRYVYLIYNLGTGLGKCKSNSPVHVKQRNDIVVTRDTKISTLELNGNQISCESRGPAVGLNVQSVFYLGGVPDLSQVQAMAYESNEDLRDYTGCVYNLTINSFSFNLNERGARSGRNILNCDASQMVV